MCSSYKNCDLIFRANLMLMNLKAKGVIIFSCKDLCCRVLQVCNNSPSLFTCKFIVCGFCRHLVCWQSLFSTNCHKPFLWSNLFCEHIIAFVSIDSCMSACVLITYFFYTMCIIMPFLLLCEELHLMNPVFLLGPVTWTTIVSK